MYILMYLEKSYGGFSFFFGVKEKNWTTEWDVKDEVWSVSDPVLGFSRDDGFYEVEAPPEDPWNLFIRAMEAETAEWAWSVIFLDQYCFAKTSDKYGPGSVHIKKLPQLSMYVYVLHGRRIFVDSSPLFC